MKKELLSLINKHKWEIAIEMVFIVIHIYLIAIPSRIIGNLINYLYDIDANKALINESLIKLLLVCIGFLIARVIWKNLELKVELSMMKELKDNMFSKMLKTKIEKLEEIKNGKIMSFFVSDTKKVAKLFSKCISAVIRIVLNFTIVGYLMINSSNIKLTLISLIPVFISIIIVIVMRNIVSEGFKKSQRSFTELSEYVQESTDSIRTMKAFVGEEEQIREFKVKNAEVKNSNLRVVRYQNLLDIIINTGFGLAYAIALLIGSNMVINGEMKIGDIVAFIGYLGTLTRPVNWIPWIIFRYKRAKISMDRLDELIGLEEEKIDVRDIKNYGELKGNIKIKDLTYNYPGYIERVLENVNIDIKQGESLGIIGVIGSGKTTLMNLLLKLYDVERGKKYIDGVDINDIPVKKIRDNICYITQDNFLFSATLKENINLFKDEYEDSQIEDSTKQAMIYEEISNMQEGIHTVIGEKGIDLSGGQKQRVVISRAFLNNSNIVIFDDTFSALDNRTEQHVLNNIKELTKNKTCIIVSNRISDIKDCDKIIVLDQGEIVERGNHKSLLAEKGKYYDFFESQAHKAEFAVLE